MKTQANLADSKEIKMLQTLINAVNNLASITSGHTSISTNQYNLLSADTLTLEAGTYKSISLQVIKGSVNISMDGGSTSINYPIGTEISVDGGTINSEWILLVAGSASDGLNQCLVQTTK